MDLNNPILQQAFAPRPTVEEFKYVEIGKFPNQRNLIIPDEGMTIIDMDLNRADAQIVAWEADDEILKEALKKGEDIWWLAAKELFGPHVLEVSHERQMSRQVIHAYHYGAFPKKVSRSFGVEMKTAEWFFAKWFQLHPKIKEWHRRVKNELATKRLVRNPFGFERYYFERPENVFNEALAWVPQSSVGIIINEAWYNINKNLPEVEVIMQVHDSLTMQVPSQLVDELLPVIQKQSLIVVPYADPLIIPVGFKTSPRSWGHVKDPCWIKAKKAGEKPICINEKLHLKLTEGLASAKLKASTGLVKDIHGNL